MYVYFPLRFKWILVRLLKKRRTMSANTYPIRGKFTFGCKFIVIHCSLTYIYREGWQRALSHAINTIFIFIFLRGNSLDVTYSLISIYEVRVYSYKGEMSRVLVTGASGFLASHVVRQLLEAGQHRVRGTVRSLANEEKVGPLRHLCPEYAMYELELVEADLMNKDSWQE